MFFSVGESMDIYRTQTPGFSKNLYPTMTFGKCGESLESAGWDGICDRWGDRYPVHLLTDWQHGCRTVLYNVPYGLMLWLFVVTDSEPRRDSLNMFEIVWLRILKKIEIKRYQIHNPVMILISVRAPPPPGYTASFPHVKTRGVSKLLRRFVRDKIVSLGWHLRMGLISKMKAALIWANTSTALPINH